MTLFKQFLVSAYLSLGLAIVSLTAFASTDTAHSPTKAEHSDREEKAGEPREHEEGEGAPRERGKEGDEASPKIGPGKGILAYDEHTGMKLAPEAISAFEIKTVKLQGAGPWIIPDASRVLTGEDENIFRVRDGSFSRIDFKILEGRSGTLKISAPDLKAGDEIVTSGAGFLRVAEIAASGGTPEGHSH